MKRLSQTWRQKNRRNDTAIAAKSSLSTADHDQETPRRSQRLAKSWTSKNGSRSTVLEEVTRTQGKNNSRKSNTRVNNTSNTSEQGSFFSTSFGLEFDADALSAVDKMEKDHLCKKKKSILKSEVSPITPICFKRSSSPAFPVHSNVNIMRSTPKDKPVNENDFSEVVDHEGHLRQSFTRDKPGKTMTCAIQTTPSPETKCRNRLGKAVGNLRQVSDAASSANISENPKLPENNVEEFLNVHSSITNPKKSEKSVGEIKTGGNSSPRISPDRCQLSSWGLPESVLKQYEKIGINTMFEWQAECLCTGNVLNGGNLVYSAPTSAGKTMVAELLMLKRILDTKCKALFILPFVSVAREKMFYLQRMFQDAGIKVDGYMGNLAPTKGFASLDVAVCTIEKANSLVNRLMEDGQLHTVGSIVVDEMHLIGDPSRGYLLELLLTKVLYTEEPSVDNESPSRRNVQIIGMSATLPNLDVLAKWLRADLFFTDFRPVPLTETLKVGKVIYDKEGKRLRELSQSLMVSGDDDHVLLLCQETVEEGHAVLIFCPTKSWCEKLAQSVAKHFLKLGSAKLNGVTGGDKGSVNASSLVMFDYDNLKDVFEQLKSCQVGLDSVLGRTLRYGVAYHHAGLTFDERDIIEGAFRQGIIKVLIATSTLSSGVNLPARRVIIRTPIFHGKLMDGLVYKQMSGRAGRKGVDSKGESIIICKPAERQKANSLLQADLKPVESCLIVKRSDEDEGNGIKRALLEVIASGVATTPADVQRYASCTFYVSSKAEEGGRSTMTIIESTVDYLARNEFITLRKEEEADAEENSSPAGRFVPTQLGQATLASALSPDEALVVFADLRKARKCFVLENELHIIYQVTPIYLQDQWPNLDWYQYLKIWEHLPSHMKRVAELVGVEERFLTRAIRGRVPIHTETDRRAVGVHKRFYVSLALQDLVHEVPLNVVARKFGASRGMLQSLQTSAATFAGMVTVFCHKLGWINLEMLLSQFHNRLSFGVERELCDLVRISVLNGFRARLLYDAGYHTVAAVASASPGEIEKHLRNATPFQSNKRSEWESELDLRRRMHAKSVWVDGRRALTEAEAAREIVGEAREILKEDASQLGTEWRPDSRKTPGNSSKTSGVSLKVFKTDRITTGVTFDGPGVTTEICRTTADGVRNKSEILRNASYPNKGTTTTLPTTSDSPRITSDVLRTSSVLAGRTPEQSRAKSAVSESMPAPVETATAVSRSTPGTNRATTDVRHVEPNKSSTDCDSDNTSPGPSEEICNVGTIAKSPDINLSHSRQCEKLRPNTSTSGERTGECSRMTPARNTVCFNISGNTARGICGSRTILKLNREDVSTTGRAVDSSERLPSDAACSSSKPERDEDVNLPKMIGNHEDDERSLKRRHSESNATVECSSPKRSIVDPRKTEGSSKDQTVPCSSGLRSNEVNSLSDTLSSRSSENSIKNTPVKNVSNYGAIFQKTHSPNSQNNPLENTPRSVSKENIAPSNGTCRPTKGDNGKEMARNTISNTTRTPSCEKYFPLIQGESPELIVINESAHGHGDPDEAESRTPFSDIENRKKIMRSFSSSPELYSEALFPDDESSQSLNKGPEYQEIVPKMSESCGFGTLDSSLELYSQETKIKNVNPLPKKEQTSENEGLDTQMVVPGLKTPGSNQGKNEAQEYDKQDSDPVHSRTICTPEMFDSEVCNSQSVHGGITSEISPDDAVVTNQSISDQSHRSSASSFCLKLSQSFEDASGSDLSPKTLAVVAAMEDKEVEVVMNEEGYHGTQGFQMDSDISNEAVAAIEAMEIAMNHRRDKSDMSCTDSPSHFTAVKNRSFGFISKPIPELDSSAKLHKTVASDTLSRSQLPRISIKAGVGDTSMKQSIVDDDYDNDDTFTIIDVTMHRKLFTTFLEEWKTKSFSFSVALEKLPHRTSTIGGNFNKEAIPSRESEDVWLAIDDERVVVVGLAICWEDRDAYYVSLRELGEGDEFCSAQNTHGTPHVAAGLTLKERLDSLQVVMGFDKNHQVKTAFGIKDQFKVLSRACGLVTKGELQDPKVATWLLDPGAKERNFHQLVEHFLPQETGLLQDIGGSLGLVGLGLAAQRQVSARMRASVEAVLTMKLMEHVRPILEAEGLLHAFTKIEMPAMSCLARMELNGLGFSNNECENIKHVLQAKLRSLEQDAYRMADHSFSLASPEDVSRVLFLELKLPPDGNSDSLASPGKSCIVKPTRGGRGRKVKYFSTSKDVLEKLIPLHPLARVVLEWRRVNSALTKVVFPVQKEQIHCDSPLNMSRIYSMSFTHTATGRVTFVEPNLQNVPKDFDINLPTVISDTPPPETMPYLTGWRSRKRGRNVGVFVPGGDLERSSPGPQFSVSMRSAFIPFSKGVFLGADYSQLELRLIAHLSNDKKLADILNAGGDVFKMIGGEMFHIPQESIPDDQRQRAKQVCYGIIYGIGAKALGLQLGVSEEEAAVFVNAFKSRFIGVCSYLKKTVDECRKLGYVTTISGRKRHLPNIRASSSAAKAQAERQAVNTTVQGSAADLVKLAMVNIDKRLCHEFPSCWRTHRQKSNRKLWRNSARVGKRSSHERDLRGAYLVLQLHDELLFEVAEDDLEKVVGVVQEEMENAMKLSVKIPVKIKVGKSWGTLQPVEDWVQ